MSSIVPLGMLELVDLRSAWPNEASNFTPWLAKEANLRALGDVLGLELRLEKIEKEVETFSADILAKDMISDRWVLIENQLEQTDHTHLGQILTYAAGLDAQTVVWIARNFREPHRAAIDYLNRISTEEHNFFAVQIELYRIGNSPYAPRFSIVSKPNNWSKNVASTAQERAETSKRQNEWTKYWIDFIPFAVSKGFAVANRVPPREGWFRLLVALPGSDYTVLYAHRDARRVRVLFWLQGDDPQSLLDRLQVNKNEIEENLGFNLVWDPMPNRKSAMIAVETPISSLGGETGEYEWMADKARLMERAFKPFFEAVRDSKL